MMRVRAAIVVIAVVLAGLVAAPASATASAPTLVVSGNHLVDTRTNATFTPHGVNWPSFEYACQQGWGYSGGFSAKEAQAIASWQVNVVRIPLNENCWLGTGGSPAYGTAAGYRSSVQSWVSLLHAAGLAVILDLHWTAPAGYVADGQRAMPDAQSTTFWSSAAAAFAADPSVVFDLFNEPYSRWNDATDSWAFQLSWSCWKNGGCRAPVENDDTATLSGKTYSVVGMSQLVATVRAAGAAQPIMLGGLDYSNDLTGWLANRPSDTQLVASWHNYPGQRCDTVACWNSEIAPVAASVPVIAGEFGETDGGSSFLTNFMAWADSHGVGYAPWAWWDVPTSESVSSSRYALYSGSSFTPKAPSGTTYHDHLAALASAPGSPPAGSPSAPQPVGRVDNLQPLPAAVGIWGWAVDTDTTNPIYVHVYIDGAMVGGYLADATSSEADTAWHLGTQHGFNLTVPTNAGTHNVCVYAINVGPGSNSQLGCWQTTVGGNPIGTIENIQNEPGGFGIFGWAFDPDMADPIYIHLYLDGTMIGGYLANGQRTDVAAAHVGYGAAHGLAATVPAPAGNHTLCAYALNTAAGSNTTLGCWNLNIGGSPVGAVENAQPTAGGINIWGWVYDPDVATPTMVHVYVDGQMRGGYTAGNSRPDLGLMTGYGSNHGFAITVPASPGAHNVCVYGINLGAGGNTQLRCFTTTV